MKCALALCLVVACGAVSAEVYKWKDDSGRVHFGDKPPAHAAREALRIQSFSGAADVSGDAPGGVGPVTMYSTAWCGVCKRARQWFASKGVAFTEIDIEKQPAGKAEFQRLGGRGVPLIVVGEQRMNGFDAARLEQMLKAPTAGGESAR